MSTELDQFIDGIACKELIGSGEGEFTFDSSRLTRIFRCAWDKRIDLTRKLLGEITVDPDGNSVQTPPKSHPEIDTLYCRRVQVSAFDAGSKTVATSASADLNVTGISYDFAKLTATYEPFVSEFLPGDQLITEEFDVSSEVIETDGGTFKWSNGDLVAHKHFVLTGITEDVIVFHRSASSKRSVIKAMVGTVNSATFADSPRGSLLFLGGRGRRSVLTNGVEQWEIAYKFSHRSLGSGLEIDSWQKLWKPGGGWDTVSRSEPGGGGIYKYSNFNQLVS